MVMEFNGNVPIIFGFNQFSLAINIALNFYLIPTHGINGAAMATLISLIIWNSITTLLIFSKDKIKIFLN